MRGLCWLLVGLLWSCASTSSAPGVLAGGPWNQDWQIFIDDQGQGGSREQHFDYASLMIQKYGLFGLTMTYWQQVDLAPIPVGD